MLNFLGSSSRTCDGVSRRSFLKVGALTLGGLALPQLLQSRAAAAAAGKPVKKTAVIQLVLNGGPTHIETWDPKPDAPAEFKGPYNPINTCVEGIQLPEIYPLLAKQMDKFSILRSVHHNNSSHGPGRHWMLTGYQPTNAQGGVAEKPSTGAVAAKFRGANKEGVPAYVNIPRLSSYSGSAHLGVGFNPFEVGDPNQRGFSVRNLKLPNGIDMDRLDDRKSLLSEFDHMRRDLDTRGTLAGLDSFTRSAFEMITGKAARDAFDIEKETPELREKYGKNTLGQSFLLARRLIEAGVTFVTVEDTGWDMHGQIKNAMDRKGPIVDRALATLGEDLAARNMLDQVFIIVLGEFGRTPKVNNGAGRDHWGNVFSVLLGGGGLRNGQVVGSSSPKGETPKDRPLRPEDVLSTMYHVLGIDHHATVNDNSGRPIHLLPGGTPIKELV